MLLFNNDYNVLCHPEVMEYVNACSSNQYLGYGDDTVCAYAADLIKEQCCTPDAKVYFMTGGTQTNLTLIATSLRPHQAVVSAHSGHIQEHETGAIEATGHKVISLPSDDGKITAEQIRRLSYEHNSSEIAHFITQPKMVYISFPTEYGTIYSLSELKDISAACKENGLYLYIDGARLGYGLTAAGNDVSLQDVAALSDAFYIGGTKVGAMIGEALVINNDYIAEDFKYMLKQRGALLAKGWLMGAQFAALFKDGLYFTIAKNANSCADVLRDCLKGLGYKLAPENTTNQVFVILPNRVLDKLSKKFTFSRWEPLDDDNTVVRFCTTWSTQMSAVKELCDTLTNLSD